MKCLSDYVPALLYHLWTSEAPFSGNGGDEEGMHVVDEKGVQPSWWIGV